MRIAIDAREFSRPQSGGFKTYLMGLFRGLSEIGCEDEFILYVDGPIEDTGNQMPKKHSIRLLTGNRIYNDIVGLRNAVVHDKPDVIHFPGNYGIPIKGVPSVLTLHDCIGLTNRWKPSSFKSALVARYCGMMTRFSVPHVDSVITVSGYSRTQIGRHFPNLKAPVNVVYNAGKIASNCPDDVVETNLISGKYFLVLASVDPRKNVETAISAFALSNSAKDCTLVAVCSHQAAAAVVGQAICRAGISENSRILTSVSNNQLRELYRGCYAFVFPSIEEGFGLPPLEAMGYGAPVISSNASCMPEVLGEGAVYFDPYNPPELASLLDRIHGDVTFRDSLSLRGPQKSQEYSWAKTAERTLVVYNCAADGHNCL